MSQPIQFEALDGPALADLLELSLQVEYPALVPVSRKLVEQAARELRRLHELAQPKDPRNEINAQRELRGTFRGNGAAEGNHPILRKYSYPQKKGPPSDN